MKKRLNKILPHIQPNLLNNIEVFSSDKIAAFVPRNYRGLMGEIPRAAVIPCPASAFTKTGVKRIVPKLEKVFMACQNNNGSSGNNPIALLVDNIFLHEISRSMYGGMVVHLNDGVFPLDRNLQTLIALFMDEAGGERKGSEFVLDSLSIHIAVSLLRSLKKQGGASPAGNRGSEKENINRAIQFLKKRFNSQYSLDDVARQANLSPYHFIRVFKAHTGKTPYDFLLDVKIQKAREMLRSGLRTVTEICYLCGFNNLSHFTAVFKRKVGVAPSDYRRGFFEG